MNFKKLLLTAAAAAVLSATGTGLALADPYDHGGPGHHDSDRHDDRHDGDRRDDRGGHDRYWRPEFRGHSYVDRDRVFVELRHHHYNRFVGDPYWFQGHYVVRSYDRWGHIVFVEVNPYTGGFVGEIRF
ncbi:MAG: hypothetical protein WCA78_08935 [Rhizomicrobium sp.]